VNGLKQQNGTTGCVNLIVITAMLMFLLLAHVLVTRTQPRAVAYAAALHLLSLAAPTAAPALAPATR